MLPDNDVGGDTILAVVHENDTILGQYPPLQANSVLGSNLQAIGVHGLASEELKVLEVGQELVLDVLLGTSLEGGDLLLRAASLLESSLNSLHVA